MSAQGNIYFIHNRGIDGKKIFKDEQDYQTFLNFLDEYLSDNSSHGSVKKEFTIRGKSFKGVPHQVKKYHNNIDLIAYGLNPPSFKLIIREKKDESLEKFMRSLGTRYSMYFNKKYNRKGKLFEGSYNSQNVKDKLLLLHLTRHLHATAKHSSYQAFLGTIKASWIKPYTVLAYFVSYKGKDIGNSSKGNYKKFVESYKDNSTRTDKLLEGIVPKESIEHLERSNLDSINAHAKDKSEALERSNLPSYLVSSLCFVLLFSSSFWRIHKNKKTIDSAAVSGVHTEATSDIQDQAVATYLRVIIDSQATANIRIKPSIDSKVIDHAKNGDTFELIDNSPSWYEIKLANGSIGFLSTSIDVEIQ